MKDHARYTKLMLKETIEVTIKRENAFRLKMKVCDNNL